MGLMQDAAFANQLDSTKANELQALLLLSSSTYTHIDKAKVQARLDKLLKKMGVYK